MSNDDLHFGLLLYIFSMGEGGHTSQGFYEYPQPWMSQIRAKRIDRIEETWRLIAA
jgi:hypothetical protein